MPDFLPQVTVAVCTHGRPKLLAATLRCLVRQNYPADRYGVLVIDNAPHLEACAEVVRTFQSEAVAVHYRPCFAVGLSHARNLAVLHGQRELIVFVDDDVVCEPIWLNQLVAPMAADVDGTIAAVGGEVVPVYSEGVCRCGVQIYRPLRLRADSGPIRSTQMLMGANMAFRRAALIDVGLFDSRVGRNGGALLAGDENRPIDRLRRNGYQVWFVPDARVFHELPRARTCLGYGIRHGFDSARSRVLNKVSALEDLGLSAASFLWSRLLLNLLKLTLLVIQATLLALLVQRTALCPVLVRIARALGYKLEIFRVLTRSWRQEPSPEGERNRGLLPVRTEVEKVFP